MSWDNFLRIDAANDYMAIDALWDELGKLDSNNTKVFAQCLFRLLKLHRSFYQKAVHILLEDQELEYTSEVKQFRKAIRAEQRKLIYILRILWRKESLPEKLFQLRQAEEISTFIQKCFDTIYDDWRVGEDGTLVFDPID